MARKTDKQLAAQNGKGNAPVPFDAELAESQKALAREFAAGLKERLPKIFALIDRLLEADAPLSEEGVTEDVVKNLVELERQRGSRVRYEVQLVLGLIGKIAGDKKEYQNNQPVAAAPQFNFLIQDGGAIKRGNREAVERAIDVSQKRRTKGARASS